MSNFVRGYLEVTVQYSLCVCVYSVCAHVHVNV